MKYDLALQKLVDRLAKISPIPIILTFDHAKTASTSVGVQQELMRICQEAVNNAIKHSNAKQIWINLGVTDKGSVSLKVRDDGNGFDVRRVVMPGDGLHFGLVGLSERAKRIGGELAILSELGNGTEIELTIRSRARLSSSIEVSQPDLSFP